MKLSSLKTEREGFTLIEMLVVLAIISVLSVASVNGYMSYRTSALLDFAADNLVSEFNQLRSKTIYQDNNSEKLEEIKGQLGNPTTVINSNTVTTTNLCYGMSFKQDGDFYSISNFSQKFDGEKIWDLKKNAWVYSGCGGDKNPLPMEYDPEVKIISVEGSGDLVINFVPPKGELEVNQDLESVLIKLQYGEITDESLQKVVRIDFKNALAEVL